MINSKYYKLYKNFKKLIKFQNPKQQQDIQELIYKKQSIK